MFPTPSSKIGMKWDLGRGVVMNRGYNWFVMMQKRIAMYTWATGPLVAIEQHGKKGWGSLLHLNPCIRNVSNGKITGRIWQLSSFHDEWFDNNERCVTDVLCMVDLHDRDQSRYNNVLTATRISVLRKVEIFVFVTSLCSKWWTLNRNRRKNNNFQHQHGSSRWCFYIDLKINKMLPSHSQKTKPSAQVAYASNAYMDG